MIITVKQPSELQRCGVRLALWAASVVVSFDCPVLSGRDDHADGDDDDSDCGDYIDADPEQKMKSIMTYCCFLRLSSSA